jgi:Glyoxalase-like domain
MTKIQIVLDCEDCVRQGLWWAETLGWEFEWLDPERFEQLKADGHCTDDQVVTIDGRLSWRDGAAISSVGPQESQQRMYLQNVPERKTTKNRMHLDLHVGADVADAVVQELIVRGATRIGEGSQGPHAWVVMADPEGNEFCVA